MRHYLIVLFIVLVMIVPWFAVNYPHELSLFLKEIEFARNQVANVFISHNPKTIDQIKSKYDSAITLSAAADSKKVKILLAPGHEPNFGGAEFGTLKERDMSVELAQDLKDLLSSNPRYEVSVTRNNTSWNPVFDNYFQKEWQNISEWVRAHREEVTQMTRLGLLKPTFSPVIHNKAPMEVATRLYGIGKWANENDVDIIIHIHFNDYPGHSSQPGKYSGFTIYVPQNEYANSTTTRALADSIFRRIAKYNPVSDFSGESGGIVPDPDLIAVGAFNSLDAASMLIEYGYVYEPQFSTGDLRSAAIKDLAFQTYMGLGDFFEPKTVVNASGFDTLIVPSRWENPITERGNSAEIFALQTALLSLGDYPPEGRSLNECPRSGKMGACTKAAIESFQKKYGITGEEGMAGRKTLKELNKIYLGID